MTSPYYIKELKKYGLVFRWRKYLLAGRTEAELGQDEEFLLHSVQALRGFQNEYQHRLQFEVRYTDDLDRLAKLKQAIRDGELIVVYLQQQAELPESARAFSAWVRATMLDMSSSVWFLEARYPERQHEFDADRDK